MQVSNINDAISIAAGSTHACALRSNGVVNCWGANSVGQLGNNSTTNQSVPVPVANITTAIGVAAGAQHSCAILGSGLAQCWGNNNLGQIGDGTVTVRLTPVTVLVAAATELRGVGQMGGGNFHTCALQANGQPFCWGFNNFGQLGDGTTGNRSFATQVPSFTFNIVPSALIKPDGKKAQVIALANCEAGAQARIHIELTQGRNVGQGQAVVECTGALERYPVEFTAHGKDRFTTGPAEASAVAEVKDHGTVIDVQEWTRNVTISVGDFVD